MRRLLAAETPRWSRFCKVPAKQHAGPILLVEPGRARPRPKPNTESLARRSSTGIVVNRSLRGRASLVEPHPEGASQRANHQQCREHSDQRCLNSRFHLTHKTHESLLWFWLSTLRSASQSQISPALPDRPGILSAIQGPAAVRRSSVGKTQESWTAGNLIASFIYGTCESLPRKVPLDTPRSAG